MRTSSFILPWHSIDNISVCVFCSNKNRTNNTQITVLFNLQVSFIIFTCVLSYELMSLLNGMSLYFILISCSSNYFYVKRLRCAFVWCDYFSVGCYKWQYIARKVSCPSLMCMYIRPWKTCSSIIFTKKNSSLGFLNSTIKK